MTNEQQAKSIREIILSQQLARKMIKRGIRVLIPSFFIALGLFYFLSGWLPSILNSILLFGIIIGFYIVNNWIQWNALIVNQIRCPHCEKLLAKNINLFISPSPRCPHCKELAIMSGEQLDNFKLEEHIDNQEV